MWIELCCLRKQRSRISLAMSGRSKCFLSARFVHSEELASWFLVDLYIDYHGSLVIFRLASVRPMCIQTHRTPGLFPNGTSLGVRGKHCCSSGACSLISDYLFPTPSTCASGIIGPLKHLAGIYRMLQKNRQVVGKRHSRRSRNGTTIDAQ